MYTIKQASLRTGVGVPLLRAWERRYGIPSPARTRAGYRLYDEPALARVRRLRSLVESGMAPSQAARSIAEAEASGAWTPVPAGGATVEPATRPSDDPVGRTIARFVAAATALDDAELQATLADAMAALGVDDAIERVVLPAMVAVGEGWRRGEIDVAGEHAASGAVVRRIAALYENASGAARRVDCVVGLPPGSRHEIGALAFALGCRRAGLRVLYLGADVPTASWLQVAQEQPAAALVLGAVTDVEGDAAAEVAQAVRAAFPKTYVAVGGNGAERAALSAPGLAVLPADLGRAVALVRERRRARPVS